MILLEAVLGIYVIGFVLSMLYLLYVNLSYSKKLISLSTFLECIRFALCWPMYAIVLFKILISGG